MRSLYDLVRAFERNRSGSVAIIFALSCIMLMTAVGLAIDGARVFHQASKVGDALDSAAIGAARLFDTNPNPGQTAIEKVAKDYFAAHVTKADVGMATFGTLNVPKFTDGTVELEIETTVPTLFGGIVGIPEFKFTKQSTVIYSSRTVEVAMALDITGSMCGDPLTQPRPCTYGPKLDGLKAAANDLVTELYADNPKPGATRIGMVPYHAAVNLGPIYSPMAAHTPSPDHCVIERDGAEAYTSTVASGGNRVDTQYEIPSNRRSPQEDYWCPTAQIAPLADLSDSTARATFNTQLNALSADGWTSGHIGAAWAWYMVAPSWASFWQGNSQPKPASANSIKAVVLMTDGLFNNAYRNGGENYPASSDPTSPSGDKNIDGTSANQALKLCSGMRAEGIRIYTVMFMTAAEPGYAQAKDLLETCAAGSNGGFFEAGNVTQLRDSFREIGRKLTQVRVSG